MKKKTTFIISMVMALTMAFSLAACKDDNPTGGGGKTPPTQQQWEQAGIEGSFTAEISGTLASSNVTAEGEISMKWTGSNEQSLDNTITWLKGQGYDSYGGQSAEKTTDGYMKTYMAEKTIGGASAMSANANEASVVVPMSYTYAAAAAAPQESKTMIAESYYITADFSIMGVSFKAGELYLDIYEAEEVSLPSGLIDTWPATQIQNALGASIPAYTGTGEYQITDASIGYMKQVQINVFGATEADESAYITALTQNGFTENEGVYEKTLTNGDVLQVLATMSQTYHPSTYQLVEVLSITAMLEKNSGTYTSWNGLNLSDFSAGGIPAYSGGTSFDIDDAGTDEMISVEDYEQMIESLAPYEHLLDAETKQQLEEARRYVELAAQVRAKVVTVYGTNVSEAEAYETALSTAGFVGGLKNVGDYQYQVEISEEDGKALISIVKVPIELAEEIDEDGSGNQSGNTPVEDEKLDFSDLPTNVKFTLVDVNNSQYTVTKIGNDYLIDTLGVISCLKYSGTEWVEYTYFDGTWTENTEDTYSQLKYHSFMSVVSDVLFDNEVSDFSQGANEQIAGQACEVYTLEDNSMASYGLTTTSVRKLNEDGFVFYHSEIYYMNGQLYMTTTYQISLWDTSVTAFEVALPQ